MATEAADADLLRQVRNGRPEAYNQIFKRHRDHAFGLAYYYTKNKEDALDVVQDAFIKAYQNLNRFDLKREFGPWLLTIVRNQAIDLLRKRNRRRSEDLPEVLPDRKAQSKTEGGLLRMEIRNALDRLPPEQREIIFLKDYQGHSYAEIAEIQEIPLGTVMSRLHHARKKLIRYLDGSDA
ncbi:MAG TPA: RNA polymerase sigma factor [Acidobacteriota bacterium]|nr:RNA polymerase sigma factor [Acidobacteriota bacterium]